MTKPLTASAPKSDHRTESDNRQNCEGETDERDVSKNRRKLF